MQADMLLMIHVIYIGISGALQREAPTLLKTSDLYVT